MPNTTDRNSETPVNTQSSNILGKPLELPCGVVLKNRLAKSAMSDSLGDGEGNPTKPQMRLYKRWAEGGTALSLIGEVQVDPRYPEKPGNLVLNGQADPNAMRELAIAGSKNGTHLWPQLGHAGALSHGPISNPKGPSALDLNGLQCQEMSIEDIRELPFIYAKAAKLAQELGFGGVQIHAGHGFLLSQFISPLFNLRADNYGGSVAGRFRIVSEIIEQVRDAVGPTFPIAIKINSTDQLIGGLTGEDSMEIIRILDQTSVDLIDVGGGTYFPGAQSSSEGKSSSGPYFIDFTKRAKQQTKIPIMATGGFTAKDQAVDAIESGTADMVNLARAMVINPQTANMWLGETVYQPQFPKFSSTPPGGVTAWYTMAMSMLGEDQDAQLEWDAHKALDNYEERDAKRCEIWKRKFDL